MCGKKTRRPRFVILLVGDGFRVDVCAACMNKNGWRDGAEIKKVP